MEHFTHGEEAERVVPLYVIRRSEGCGCSSSAVPLLHRQSAMTYAIVYGSTFFITGYEKSLRNESDRNQ